MEIQSTRKGTWLASAGCALGVLSLGLIAVRFIIPFVYDFNKYELTKPLTAGFPVLFDIVGFILDFILGLIGLVISLVAFKKIRKDGNNATKRIAIVGLVSGGIGVTIVCTLFVLFFRHHSPPPVMPSITILPGW